MSEKAEPVGFLRRQEVRFLQLLIMKSPNLTPKRFFTPARNMGIPFYKKKHKQ